MAKHVQIVDSRIPGLWSLRACIDIYRRYLVLNVYYYWIADIYSANRTQSLFYASLISPSLHQLFAFRFILFIITAPRRWSISSPILFRQISNMVSVWIKHWDVHDKNKKRRRPTVLFSKASVRYCAPVGPIRFSERSRVVSIYVEKCASIWERWTEN